MKTKNVVLLDEEIAAFKSMNLYWKEVEKREDRNPLYHEASMVNATLGIRILDLVMDYIELVEEHRK